MPGDQRPAKRPCGSCPYRRDVPSGLWAEEEYDKLPLYDGPTMTQPPAAFFCHQQNGRLCAGWVGCHDMNEALALRFMGGPLSPEAVEAALDYVSPVPLWESGAAAAAHGKRDIEAPGTQAQKKIEKLIARRDRREQRKGE